MMMPMMKFLAKVMTLHTPVTRLPVKLVRVACRPGSSSVVSQLVASL